MDDWHETPFYSTVGRADRIDIITKKIEALRTRIENYCNENGYDKMGNQIERKNEEGTIYYKLSDWEFVDDTYANMINLDNFLPHPNSFIKMNKLWKKYK